MTTKNFVEGINIIAKYCVDDEFDTYDVEAEHDQIWFGEFDAVDNSDDKERLFELGWFESLGYWSCFP